MRQLKETGGAKNDLDRAVHELKAAKKRLEEKVRLPLCSILSLCDYLNTRI